MSEENKASQATEPKSLRERIMDSRIAKSESEWWASREIEKLEAALAEARKENEEQARLLMEAINEARKCCLADDSPCDHKPRTIWEAVAKERELCAQLFDTYHPKIAAQIRARGAPLPENSKHAKGCDGNCGESWKGGPQCLY